jgi:hypothetical protein
MALEAFDIKSTLSLLKGLLKGATAVDLTGLYCLVSWSKYIYLSQTSTNNIY